jgi:membrane protease YdiL (CAAX protease family)
MRSIRRPSRRQCAAACARPGWRRKHISLSPPPLTQSQVNAAGLATLPTAALLLFNGLYLAAAYRTDSRLFWALDIVQFVIVPATSCWLLWRLAGVPPSRYGLGRIAAERQRLKALLIYAAVVAAFAFGYPIARALALFAPWLWSGSSFSYQMAIPLGAGAALATVAYLAFSAGLAEEVVFRGLPALYLGARLPPAAFPRIYAAASAALFAAIHWEQGSRELLATFLVGLGAAWLYLKIRNLWPFVFGHAYADVLAFSGYYG